MFDAKNVAVTETGPMPRVKSADALRPRSARSGAGTRSFANPAASVSSVIAVDGKKPVPYERRLDHACWRNRAETRGLRNAPYLFWRSSRALADTASHFARSTSS